MHSKTKLKLIFHCGPSDYYFLLLAGTVPVIDYSTVDYFVIERRGVLYTQLNTRYSIGMHTTR